MSKPGQKQAQEKREVGTNERGFQSLGCHKESYFFLS